MNRTLTRALTMLLAVLMLVPVFACFPTAASAAAENDPVYPFAVDGSVICSTNKGNSTVSTYTYTVENEGLFELGYKVSSEKNYDKLSIALNAATLVTVSGVGSGWRTVEVNASVGDVITVTYSKDGSMSSGSDCCWVDFTNLDNNVQIAPPDPTEDSDNHIPLYEAGGTPYVIFASGRSGDGRGYGDRDNYETDSVSNGGYDIYVAYHSCNNIQIGRSFTVFCEINEVAELAIYAYDVDESDGEVDRVWLDDLTAGTSVALGTLSGMDDSWNNTSFRIDPENLIQGHTYRFRMCSEVSGWVVYLRNITLTVNGAGTSAPIASASATASIGRDFQATVDVTAQAGEGFEDKLYDLEIKATAVTTEAQHGQYFGTMEVTGVSATVPCTFPLESGAPEGTYRFDVYWKDPATGAVVKTATTTAATPSFASVAYHPNGGSNNIPLDNTAYLSGDQVTVLFSHIPSKAGYTFQGWATSSDATEPEYTAGGADRFTIGQEDVVLYAVWAEEAAPVPTYTVTFLGHDGTELYVTQVAEGGTAVYDAATPEKAADAAYSYTFSGWDCALTDIRSDLTVTAQFQATALVEELPKTGDLGALIIWAGLMALAGLGLIAVSAGKNRMF